MQETVQSSPAGRRAAARADRRAHAARRAGRELLVPAPPGGLRVDRRALRGPRRGRHGLRRGLRRRRAGPARAAGHRRRRQPGGPRARSPQVHPPGRALRARPGGELLPSPATRSSSSRRSSTWQNPEAVLRHFRDMLRPGGAAYVSTPNLLTLAPPGAEKSDNPWHLKEYRAEEFRALCESVFGQVELLGALPRAQAARARARAAGRLGPGARRARDHQALLRPLHAGDLGARLRAARRARSTARSTSSRCSRP